MSLAVDEPILNNPFEELREYWVYEEGQPKRIMTGKKGNMALKSVESRNVEFKSNWRDEYLKVICAFANADGGKTDRKDYC